MSANPYREDSVKKSVTLTAYIWLMMRSSLLASWFILLILSIATYCLFISWLKVNTLNSSLTASNVVISEAIVVGDWDFALNALKANANVGQIFQLTLGSVDSHTIYAGPLGNAPFGLGTYCGESRAKSKISGCIKILGSTDLLNLAAFILISIMFCLFSFFTLRRRFLSTLNEVAESLSDEFEEKSIGIKEIIAVQDRIRRLIREREISSNQRALAELAAQVAHDIRSPLGVLKILAARFSNVSTDSGHIKLVQLATQRIEDIADKLLARHRCESSGSVAVNLAPLIESIVLEKKVSFSSERISIELQPPNFDGSIWSVIEAGEFTTIISNLVNNSVESFGGSPGWILISVIHTTNHICLRISDNGPGIPRDLIDRVGRKGFQSTKAGGSGLGLLHARKKIEDWGGTLIIVSSAEEGTVIELNLPKARAPYATPSTSYISSNVRKAEKAVGGPL
jgi:signal transduction histidine kinase